MKCPQPQKSSGKCKVKLQWNNTTYPLEELTLSSVCKNVKTPEFSNTAYGSINWYNNFFQYLLKLNINPVNQQFEFWHIYIYIYIH